MTLAHVAELRRMLMSDSPCSAIWEYFLEHFSDHPDFLRLGKPVARKRLASDVGDCVAACLGRSEITPRFFYPREIPEFGLIHGSFELNERGCGVIYFPDLATGLVYLSVTTGRSVYRRYHAPPAPPWTTPELVDSFPR